jgi:hypothetical protein
MEWIDAYPSLHSITFTDEKGTIHCYEWMNDVPLNGRKDSIKVNFFRCKITSVGKKKKKIKIYQNSWVTDLMISAENITTLVKAGRCRWKAENGIFNVMKNHGYEMEHNYGHGKNNLCFNIYLLTLIAFFMHQIFELTCTIYKACRIKFGSKKHMWESLRSYIKIIVFDSWEHLLKFSLKPTDYNPTIIRGP